MTINIDAEYAAITEAHEGEQRDLGTKDTLI